MACWLCTHFILISHYLCGPILSVSVNKKLIHKIYFPNHRETHTKNISRHCINKIMISDIDLTTRYYQFLLDIWVICIDSWKMLFKLFYFFFLVYCIIHNHYNPSPYNSPTFIFWKSWHNYVKFFFGNSH